MTIYSNIKSAIELGNNPISHERTKHFGVDCHFIRDAITDEIVATAHVSTKSLLTDIFTKALGRKELEFFIYKLGILDLHAPT